MIEYEYLIEATGGSTVPEGLDPKKWVALEKLRDRPLDNLPEPNEIAAFFKECGLLSKERQEWIEGYQYYKKNRQHRRPAVFRDAWKK